LASPFRSEASPTSQRTGSFNETREADAGRWMLDGVRFLQQAVSQVQAGEIGLLVIG
jgi:hypothetical protein